MRWPCIFVITCLASWAHDGHGKKTAPASAKALKSPLTPAEAKPELGKPLYEKACATCHGTDGQAKTAQASKMKSPPTNIADHRMDSMADGEIYWVITNGIGKTMPAYKAQLHDVERWQIVLYVRHLRNAQQHKEHRP